MSQHYHCECGIVALTAPPTAAGPQNTWRRRAAKCNGPANFKPKQFDPNNAQVYYDYHWSASYGWWDNGNYLMDLPNNGVKPFVLQSHKTQSQCEQMCWDNPACVTG